MGNQRTEVRCSACDAVVTQTAQHCRRCGESFKEPSCPNPKCGAKHGPGDRFCDKCGTPIPEETPHARKTTVQIVEPYPLGGLALVLRWAIGGGILVSIWSTWAEFQRIDAVGWEYDMAGYRTLRDVKIRMDGLVDAEDALSIAWNCLAVAWLVIVVLLINWAWRATKNLQNWGAAVKWRPGWAVGGWFIPVGLIWIPYQVIRDAWRLVPVPNEPPPIRRLAVWLASWLGLVATLVLRQSTRLAEFEPNTSIPSNWTRNTWQDLQNFVQTISSLAALANVVWIISAVGLMMTVHRISTRQDELAALKR